MSVYLPEDEIHIKIYLHGGNSVGTTSFIQRYKDNIKQCLKENL